MKIYNNNAKLRFFCRYRQEKHENTKKYVADSHECATLTAINLVLFLFTS